MGYEFRPAVREMCSTLTSFAGPTGSGKTYSALRYATGLADGGKIAVIDTEAGRALHYADQFKFDHCNLSAPFSPDAYRDIIAAADEKKYAVILIDSMSHEHAGDGGMLDWHETELQRMAGDDYKKREACKMAAWIKPKMSHKRMVSKLLQCRAHLIFCLRAEEKTKLETYKDDQGYKKTRIIQPQDRPLTERWEPICEKGFMYEMTASFVLTPNNPGVGLPVKLQEQHKFAFPTEQQITEECGQAMALWAKGGKPISDEPKIDDYVYDIENAATLETLEFKFKTAYRLFKKPDDIKKLTAAKDKRKTELSTPPQGAVA